MKLLSPIPSYDLRKLRTNRTLHGRSYYRPKDVPGHNVVLGYSTPGRGDGVDLFVPRGTPVVAMHAGKVTRIADRDGKLACLYVVGKQDNTSLVTVYAHLSIKPALKVGSPVMAGQVLGYVGKKLRDPHLHLECWTGGKPVKARTGNSYRDKLVGLVTRRQAAKDAT